MDPDRKLTKKELKALRKLEREAELAKAAVGGGGAFKWIALGIVAVLFVGFFVSMVVLSKKQRAENKEKALQMLTEKGTVRGDKNAPVTLVEFADLQCPTCQSLHPIVKESLAAASTEAKLIFKHFPIASLHKNAEAAAAATEAAGKQGKFWEMVDKLYEEQGTWAAQANPQAQFEGYATSFKLDLDKFRTDMRSSEIKNKIESEKNEGINIGVMGTPTFYVNGRQIDLPKNSEELTKILKDEAAKVK